MNNAGKDTKQKKCTMLAAAFNHFAVLYNILS